MLPRGLGVRVYQAWLADPEALRLASCLSNLTLLGAQLAAGPGGVDEADPIDRGNHPLLFSADSGHEAAVQALLGAGAAINKATSDCSTALIRAAWCGHKAVAQGLLGAGTAGDTAMSDGSTPSILAAEPGYSTVLCVLLGAGALRQ